MAFAWTETAINDLSKLWHAGLSTAAIGRRIGTTKNSVVGKARRLGLPERPYPIIGKPKRMSADQVCSSEYQFSAERDAAIIARVRTFSTPRTICGYVNHFPGPKVTIDRVVKRIEELRAQGRFDMQIAPLPVAALKPAPHVAMTPEPKPPFKADLPAPAAVPQIIRPKPMSFGSPRECQWPIGTPGCQGFHFCCDEVVIGRPYCLQHCKKAYVPIKKEAA